MTERRISTEADRQEAIKWLRSAPLGFWMAFRAKKRSSDQNRRFHAMIRDVAGQIVWQDVFGRPFKMSPENWKRFFLQMYRKETIVVPNEDGTGFYDLGPRSSNMNVAEMSECMELIAAFGAERGVIFKDTPPPSEDGRAAA